MFGLKIFVCWLKKISAYIFFRLFVRTFSTHFIVYYPIGINWYKIIIPKTRKICIIDSIIDNEENDITDEIIPFMGPNRHFTKTGVTPLMLGHKRLTFITLSGDMYIFERDDEIIL